MTSTNSFICKQFPLQFTWPQQTNCSQTTTTTTTTASEAAGVHNRTHKYEDDDDVVGRSDDAQMHQRRVSVGPVLCALWPSLPPFRRSTSGLLHCICLCPAQTQGEIDRDRTEASTPSKVESVSIQCPVSNMQLLRNCVVSPYMYVCGWWLRPVWGS